MSGCFTAFLITLDTSNMVYFIVAVVVIVVFSLATECSE